MCDFRVLNSTQGQSGAAAVRILRVRVVLRPFLPALGWLVVGYATVRGIGPFHWNVCSLMDFVKVWPTIRGYEAVPCKYNIAERGWGWGRYNNSCVSDAAAYGSGSRKWSGNSERFPECDGNPWCTKINLLQ